MRWVVLCLLPAPVWADAVVATRVIKAGIVLSAADLSVVEADIPGTLTDPAQVAGQEARVAIYPGRPIRHDQIGTPAIIDRNQIVPLAYVAGGLSIVTEGRALSRGGPGDSISVLNLSSRNTVRGQIQPDGTVRVGPTEG
ncbi:MAG: flagellar basal body P-ring formation protein FlgA [Rhodobacteraceae bacterium]|nr:flagellar basal body P-ring formation protein FlgA [Paracoccaceae bacterium]